MSSYLGDPDFLTLMGEGLSKATMKTYSYLYRNMMEAFDIENLYDLFEENDIDDVENFILAHKPNTALTYIKIIKKLFVDEDMPEFLLKIENDLKGKKMDSKKEANQLLKGKLMAYKTFQVKASKLTDPLSYMVNYLLLNFNIRNMDFRLKIVFDRKEMGDKSINYIYVVNTKVFFVRNIYKTAKTYGSKENAISNQKFRKAVLEFSGGYPTYFFTNKQGEMITETNHLGAIIPKYTIGNYNESEIFKMCVREIHRKGDLNRLKRLSKNRGTALETIINEYNIDLKDFS